jgi:hypothetical protein
MSHLPSYAPKLNSAFMLPLMSAERTGAPFPRES